MEFLVPILMAACLSYLAFMVIEEFGSDQVQKRLAKISDERKEDRNGKLAQLNELKDAFLKFITPMVNRQLQRKAKSKSIKQMLTEAGQPSGNDDVFRFMALKFFFAIIGVVIALFLAVISKMALDLLLELFIIAPFSCFIIPDFMLKRKSKQRAEEITYNLPDALDLLTVCVEAGLGLDSALNRVAQEVERNSPVLSKELGRVGQDILSGITRQEAFRNMAARNNVPDLQTFAALLIQTDKLGTSISQSLRVYSDSVRTKRKQRVETLAAQASVKMIIPLVLFILPAMFVVLLAPAAISLINNFRGSSL